MESPVAPRERPKVTKRARAAASIRDWWNRPIVTWVRSKAFWWFAAFAVLWGVTAWQISVSYATQFMIGLANPFSPPICLSPCQQALAVSLRLVGWILVPAVVGATAGVIAREQMYRLFNVESKLPDPPKREGGRR
ncbi:hypothetical protein ACFCZ1_26695 [Streptomyces sp. NPDC056224]|uniref:hypothetical protein n=1 Tax=Streptomyces sp. NPDC056224 TaxID=3345750 RepID=UPI0035DD759D